MARGSTRRSKRGRKPPKPLRFDARWQRRQRWRGTWRRIRWLGPPFLLLGILLGIWFFVEGPRRPYSQDGPRASDDWVQVLTRFELCGPGANSACVIDGDTVRYGHLSNDRRIRLKGFDTPEMKGACPAEREKAIIAKRALHDWLAQGPFEWSGGTNPPREFYGRELREVRRGSDYLADHMIGLGLAEGGGWRTERIDWCR